MSILPLAVGKRVDAREKNLNLKARTLEDTPENRALLREYKSLVKAINDMPARALGLHRNFRKREIPMAYARLMADRELKMARMMEIEKKLFPKT